MSDVPETCYVRTRLQIWCGAQNLKQGHPEGKICAWKQVWDWGVKAAVKKALVRTTKILLSEVSIVYPGSSLQHSKCRKNETQVAIVNMFCNVKMQRSCCSKGA